MRYCASRLGMFLLVGKASAVLISAGTGTGNTTAPANNPGFANVGICASAAPSIWAVVGC